MRVNSRISAKCNSDNVLTGVASSGARRCVMIAVSSGDSGTGGSALTSANVSSDGDGGLLSITSDSSLFNNGGAVTMVGGGSLVTIGGDTTMSTVSSTGGSVRAASYLVAEEDQTLDEGLVFHHRSTDSGSVVMSSADVGNTCLEALRHNDSLLQDTR